MLWVSIYLYVVGLLGLYAIACDGAGKRPRLIRTYIYFLLWPVVVVICILGDLIEPLRNKPWPSWLWRP